MKINNKSSLSQKTNNIKSLIRDVYTDRKRPFIIGFSGGKDSTMTLQMVLEAIVLDKIISVEYPIHIISTDTLVETPFFISHVNNSIQLINNWAKEMGLEKKIIAHKLTPEYKNSFWVNLIGKGYPAPSQTFRWCTDRMKIKPVNKFVKQQVENGATQDVTIVIGARKDESISRKQLMENYEKNSSKLGLTEHGTLSGASIFSPISELSTDEVWLYLSTNPNPWGADNQTLINMYAQGSDSTECPTVIDDKTESCGNSRFGCWVCTVVQKDTSMENVSKEKGNEWMKELLVFRNMLKKTTDVDHKSKYRSHKRRNGKTFATRDQKRIAYGPYKMEYRKQFLKDLLKVQKRINNMGQDLKLIQDEELSLIRDIWIAENFDVEDSVSQALDEAGFKVDFEKKYEFAFDKEDKILLNDLCEEESLDPEIIGRILNTEMLNNEPSKRKNITKDIEKIFNEEWRKEKEILDELVDKDTM